MLIYIGDTTVGLIPNFFVELYFELTGAVTIAFVAVVVSCCGAPFDSSICICTPVVRLAEIDEGKHAVLTTSVCVN